MAGEETNAMWKGSSDTLELTDHPDFARADLFSAFEADPLARHDVELQMLVSGVRGSDRIPRFVLARTGSGYGHGRWLVVQIAAERGGAARPVSRRVFDDLRDAERFVFELRLRLLGELQQADLQQADLEPAEQEREQAR